MILIFSGFYFKFLYDVPDGEEGTNAWVSWLLVVFGIVGIMASALWKTKNPLEIRNDNKSGGKKVGRKLPTAEKMNLQRGVHRKLDSIRQKW